MNMDFVKAIIDEWDPVDLLAYAPKDEYDPEIQAIAQLLTQTLNVEKLAEEIYHIFSESFGQDTFTRSLAECRKIAERIVTEKS